MRTGAALAAILLLAASAAAAQDGAPKGDAARGKMLFAKAGCYECHGYAGQGAPMTGGPKLDNPVLPYQAFVNQLRNPVNVMPPYLAGELPDRDVADIYAYLQSVPAPPPLKDIPILNH